MRTFKTSRLFSAPPDAVFATIASPERLARWWGPDGFRNTMETFEFKNGGAWRLTMHGPDGTDYPNVSTFEKIENHRLVVVRHVSQPHFTLSITLEPVPEGTMVRWEQAFDSAEVAAAVQHIVEPANEQNLNRWQAELQNTNAQGGQ